MMFIVNYSKALYVYVAILLEFVSLKELPFQCSFFYKFKVTLVLKIVWSFFIAFNPIAASLCKI